MSERNEDSRNGFLFLANNLALDLLNTTPVVGGEAMELLPDFPSLLRWFIAVGVLSSDQARRLKRSSDEARQQALEKVRVFRERSRLAIIRWEKTGRIPPELIDELNHALAEHPPTLRLVLHNGQSPVLEEYLDPKEPAVLLAPLVAAAARLVATPDLARVRMCDACVLHFLDVSKKGTRRWCSMRICGNREKVAAYAARRNAAK